MSLIGAFGDIIFETSDKRVLNFVGFRRETSSRWGKHERINQKTVTEYTGSDPDKITFTILLSAGNGVSPREQMAKWITYAREGFADVLVIGGRPMGVDKWAVTNVGTPWDVVFNNGELYSGKIDVTLEEYLERI